MECDNLEEVWVSDLGNGMYKNPIIYADYSDPDVVRIDDDFYLIASSFNCTPSLPVLHSKDLVNWKIVNYISLNLPLPGYEKPQHGKGIWAPSIKYHDGRIWVYVCTPDEGLFMTNTENPEGEWSPLFHVKKVTGWIDPCPFWDEDGRGYLVHAFAKSRCGLSSLLHLCRLSEDGKEIIDDGKIIVDAVGRHHVLEGPKMFKKNGYYYITAPAGGLDHGYQVILRSKNIYGPYEEKIAMHEGNGSIKGSRQGGLVNLDSGETWFINFQNLGAYGRVVQLNPVEWKDDWMIIGKDIDKDGIGEPVSVCEKPDVGKIYPKKVPQTSDDFNEEELGLQWQWQANFDKSWYSLSLRKGWIRLFAESFSDDCTTLYDAPNILLQKFPAPEFKFETVFEFKPDNEYDTAGIMIFGIEYFYMSLALSDKMFSIALWNGFEELGKRKEVKVDSINIGSECNKIYFKVTVEKLASCQFSFSTDGKIFTDIGQKFNAVRGNWIGSKVGIFCINKKNKKSSGFTDFDWVKIKK